MSDSEEDTRPPPLVRKFRDWTRTDHRLWSLDFEDPMAIQQATTEIFDIISPPATRSSQDKKEGRMILHLWIIFYVRVLRLIANGDPEDECMETDAEHQKVTVSEIPAPPSEPKPIASSKKKNKPLTFVGLSRWDKAPPTAQDEVTAATAREWGRKILEHFYPKPKELTFFAAVSVGGWYHHGDSLKDWPEDVLKKIRSADVLEIVERDGFLVNLTSWRAFLPTMTKNSKILISYDRGETVVTCRDELLRAVLRPKACTHHPGLRNLVFDWISGQAGGFVKETSRGAIEPELDDGVFELLTLTS